MILSLYYIQNYYDYEIKRGFGDLRNYMLKDHYHHATDPDIELPENVCKPDDIIMLVRSERVNFIKSTDDMQFNNQETINIDNTNTAHSDVQQIPDIDINATILQDKQQSTSSQKSLAMQVLQGNTIT